MNRIMVVGFGVCYLCSDLISTSCLVLASLGFMFQVLWHDSLRPGQDFVGLPQVLSLVAALRTAFPDLVVAVREVHEAEQGHVLTYWSATGVCSGRIVNQIMALIRPVSIVGSGGSARASVTCMK